jgi:O-methyltransferase
MTWRLARRVVDRAAVRFRIDEDRYHEATYERLRARFIANGRESRYGEPVRRQIVERFEAVDAHVTAATSPTDALHIAEAVLSIEAEGDLVECGCYQGASTCKLSILAQVTGRQLAAFDSFEGLPSVGDADRRDQHMRHERSWFTPWTAGAWHGSLELVRTNLEAWGELGCCRLVKGWFQDTMTPEHLPRQIALAFADVDIPSSVRQCVEALWPRLARGGAFFSHDVGFVRVLQVLTDHQLWTERFREPVPIVFGAGYGLGDTSRMLGFMLRGTDLDYEYIKSLTIQK